MKSEVSIQKRSFRELLTRRVYRVTFIMTRTASNICHEIEMRKNGRLFCDLRRLDVVSIVDHDRLSKIRRAHVIDVFTHHVPGTGFVKITFVTIPIVNE